MWVFSIFVILLHEPIFYLDELERNFLVLATKFIEKFLFCNRHRYQSVYWRKVWVARENNNELDEIRVANLCVDCSWPFV